MILSGTYEFKGPRQRVWELLQDPAVLAKTLPGTERLVLSGADRFDGVMKVSIGPVTAAKFDVSVTLTEKDPPRRFVMQIDGKGGVGYTRGSATIELEEQSQALTLLRYDSNIQVGGKIAAVGQRLLEQVGKMMSKQALEALERELRTRLESEATG
ncbi:MAG: carbon monoxide dehydrogenase subunit G [Vicinamibacterales bacterium]